MSEQRYLFKNRTLPGRFHADTPKHGTIELTVDWDRIVEALGNKAAWNRSGRSGLAIGIRAKFIPVKVA